MRQEILKLIKHLEEEVDSAIKSKKMGILNEDICYETKTIYEYIIMRLKTISNHKSGQVKKEKCRCYINFKYYAHQAKIGGRGMKNYKPCPIHEREYYENRGK